jgi:hypothetical protein
MGRRTLCVVGLLVGCGRIAHVTTPDATPVVIAPPPALSAAATAPPVEEPPAKPAEAKPAEAATGTVRMDLPVRRGQMCTLVFHSTGMTEDRVDAWLITSIDSIRTEASPGCAAATVFDLAAETAADPEQKQVHESLNGGLLSKSGIAPDPSDGPAGIAVVDMNFDGYLDFSVQLMMGAYNESRRYWLYDPKKRTFEANEALGELLWPNFDATTKVIKAGGRAGGPTYTDGIYGWIGGALVTLESTMSTLGEKPNGDALPAGYARWDTIYKRKGGKLVKVFDGPVKD